jgi:hypothetical protein
VEAQMTIISGRWLKYVAFLFVGMWVALCMLLAVMITDHPINDALRLTLTIEPLSISRSDFLVGNVSATVSLTNTSKHPIEFETHGSSCFEFLDVSLRDCDNVNYICGKYGKMLISTLSARKHILISGETEERSISLTILVKDKNIQGKFFAQAFLEYRGVRVSSKVVEIAIHP